MASETEKLKLYMADPVADADNTFNIDLMLNDNWEKVDTAVKNLDTGKANTATLAAHTGDRNNPHGVTAEQAGAIPASAKGTAGGVASLDSGGKVPAAQLPAMNYDPAGSAAAVETKLTEHTGNKSNPHGVTYGQVGAAAAEHTHAQYAPLASPTFTGAPKAPAAATDYTTYRIRNMALMASAPSGAIGNGQLVGVYE